MGLPVGPGRAGMDVDTLLHRIALAVEGCGHSTGRYL